MTPSTCGGQHRVQGAAVRDEQMRRAVIALRECERDRGELRDDAVARRRQVLEAVGDTHPALPCLARHLAEVVGVDGHLVAEAAEVLGGREEVGFASADGSELLGPEHDLHLREA